MYKTIYARKADAVYGQLQCGERKHVCWNKYHQCGEYNLLTGTGIFHSYKLSTASKISLVISFARNSTTKRRCISLLLA